MPVSKHNFLRYKIINTCLLNKQKPYPSLEELKNALAKQDIRVGTRALERDLEAMRYDRQLGFFAPIVFDRFHRGYAYTDPEYSIDKLPLSADEMEAFQVSLESLKRFRGADILRQVEGVFDKLDKIVMQQTKQKKSAVNYAVVDFEKVPYSKGIELFDKVYQAIIKQQPLSIAYKRFDKPTAKEHTFHPYLLKEYKFRWYVLGYSENRRGKIILALDRIEKMAPKHIPFKANKGTDLQTYFYNTIGVTINPGGVKDIRLWVSPIQSNYLKTQHLHATQTILSEDVTGMIIGLQLVPNYELLQTILGFGPEVKVLEPSTLREEIKEMTKKMLHLYD